MFELLYIFRDFRGRGCSTGAAALWEELLRKAGARNIQTCYRCRHTAAERLARRRGCRPQYDSSCLVFTVRLRELPELPLSPHTRETGSATQLVKFAVNRLLARAKTPCRCTVLWATQGCVCTKSCTLRSAAAIPTRS